MPERALQFGDVVRVDPKANPKVPQPDNRRWMVVVPASTSARRQWTLLYMGDYASLVPFGSLAGFIVVRDE